MIKPLTPNDPYRGLTAPLISKLCILYIYSTNIDTEYFKHGIYSTFCPLQNAVCFTILTYFIPVLFTFYLQSVLKLKKNSGAKSLRKFILTLKEMVQPCISGISYFVTSVLRLYNGSITYPRFKKKKPEMIYFST
jgi:hypothetical protein